MATAFPLQPLLDLSQIRLDEAARTLGKLIAGEQEASKRHALLTEYRAEYQQRFLDAAQKGLSPKEWQNYRSFLDRLDEAVTQAAALMAQSHQRTAAGQKEWLERRGNVKAYDALSQRHQVRLSHQEQRREQKASDEFSARKRGDGQDG